MVRKGQTLLETVFILIAMLIFTLYSPHVKTNIKYINVDDVYSSVLAFDYYVGIDYNTIDYLYTNLTKITEETCIIYYNKSIGNCNESYSKTIFYIVWDRTLNKTVEMLVKIK